MRRAPILLVVVFAASLIAGGAVASAKLTSKNSAVYKYFAAGTERFSGIDCGTTATLTKTLPTGSTGVVVVEPKVGTRDLLGGGTQIVDVKVEGEVITLTALADGPTICDPSLTGVPPGEPVHWIADYDFRAEYDRRVQAPIRIYFESYTIGAKWKIRPRTIYDSRAGTPRSQRTRFSGIKWQRFGGKKAIGFGRQHFGWCRKGELCPGNNKRVRLTATKPGFCLASGRVEYQKLDIKYGGRTVQGMLLDCK